MISKEEYPDGDNEEDENNFHACLDSSIAKIRLTDDNRLSSWILPSKTMGKHVRIQLEGYNSLHFSQIEVFGYKVQEKSFGKVYTAKAGKFVSAIIVKASDDPRDKDILIDHALAADSFHKRILRGMKFYTQTIKARETHCSEGISAETQGKICVLCNCYTSSYDKCYSCEVCHLKSHFDSDLCQSNLKKLGLENDLEAVKEFLLNSPSRYGFDLTIEN